jgi:hypothetical protein
MAAGPLTPGWRLPPRRGRAPLPPLALPRLTGVPAARSYEEEPWAGPFAPPAAAAPEPGAPGPPLDQVLTTPPRTRL